jgi:hypothetical protein
VGREEAGESVKAKVGKVTSVRRGWWRLGGFDGRFCSCSNGSCSLIVDLGQAFDLETFGNFEEGGKVLLIDGHFTPVHELEERLHFVIANVTQEDDWVSVGSVVEHRLEIGGASGQDHLVGLELKTVTGEGDVDKGFMVQEVFEDTQEVVLVVVPPEAILLRHLIAGHDCLEEL